MLVLFFIEIVETTGFKAFLANLQSTVPLDNTEIFRFIQGIPVNLKENPINGNGIPCKSTEMFCSCRIMSDWDYGNFL